MRTIKMLIECIFDPKMLLACMLWPRFSFTSYKMLKALKLYDLEPDYILDVGANVGQFAIAAANTFPDASIVSFEPNPACASAWDKITQRYPNISLQGVALGQAIGELPFNINSHSHASSLLELADEHKQAFPDALVEKTITVPVRRLSEFIGSEMKDKAVLLKLDVQGYEKSVLEGCMDKLDCINYICIELSFVKMYEGEFEFYEAINFMHEHGFRALGVLSSLSSQTENKTLQMDLLFGRIV